MIGDLYISRNNIGSFSALIPPEYQDEILDGSLSGYGYYEDAGNGKNEAVGVIISRNFGRWVELEWIGIADGYKGSAAAGDMMEHLFYRLRKSTVDYVGCYMKVYKGEEETVDYLTGCGFKFGKCSDGIYEFTIDMVDKGSLDAADKYISNCRQLKEADGQLLSNVEKRLSTDDRPLPVSFPIKTDHYDRDMSLVYNDNFASGIMLASVHDDFVMIESMVSQKVHCTAALLKVFLMSFEKSFDSNTVVSVPVVSEDAKLLIRSVVPEAKQRQIQMGYFNL